MKRLIIALAVSVSLGSPALADPAAPRLKELVSVSSEVVRIGDLVDNAGSMADVPVFRAPDLGQTGAVSVAKIAEVLRPYDIAGLETGGLSEVVVTRLSRALTGKDITDSISRAFAGQYGFGDAQNIGIILDRDIRILHIEPTATADLVVSRMYFDPRNGRFDISFELPGSMAPRRASLRFTGSASETVETATLTRTIRIGEVLKVSDVATERRPKSEVRGDGMIASQAIGLAAKAVLRSGQIVRPDDLSRPQVVQRNEAVTITYEVPGIMLTVRGKATDSGAVGDVIGVLNIQSNRTVQATIIAPGRVAITAAVPVLAASTEPASDESESPRTQ